MAERIPLLEYSPDKQAVIMPGHDDVYEPFPSKAAFAFLGDEVERYCLEQNARIAGVFRTITKDFPVYILEHRGEEVCVVQAPLGAPAAAQFLDWLAGNGVRRVISSGSCGALVPFEENVFLVPFRALRDEGTSFHYAPASRFIGIGSAAREAIRAALKEHGLRYQEVVTWTTDGFFRETKEKVRRRVEEGCSVVEMECAALAAVSEMRGLTFGQLLYTADSLADTDAFDPRDWGNASLSPAMLLCLDALYYLEP